MTFFEKWKKSFDATGRLPTAYLFSGPERSGRRSAALDIAGHLLGRTTHHPDLIHIQPDLKTPKSSQRSLRIEAIRSLIQKVSLKPFESSRMVVLIEEVELMTEEAANALLKTLEEPAAHVLFILISSAPERLPATIRSRCQLVGFQTERASLQEKFADLWEESKDTVEKLLKLPARPFSEASVLTESNGTDPNHLGRLIELLRTVWRDALLLRQTGDAALTFIPQALPLTQQTLALRDAGRLFHEIDLIEETSRAFEGNVNKTLALERLFVKLMGP